MKIKYFIVILLMVILVIIALVIPQFKKADKEKIEISVHEIEDSEKIEKSISFKLNVWDETISIPADKIEIWIKGVGSWYPDISQGADQKIIKSFPVNQPESLFIYPDGRGGNEIKVIFIPTSDMISESDRDAIIIQVFDDQIIIISNAIEGREAIFRR